MRILMSLFICTLLFAQNPEYIKKGINYVEVTGESEIFVQTDEAIVSFTMEGKGSSLKKAVGRR